MTSRVFWDTESDPGGPGSATPFGGGEDSEADREEEDRVLGEITVDPEFRDAETAEQAEAALRQGERDASRRRDTGTRRDGTDVDTGDDGAARDEPERETTRRDTERRDEPRTGATRAVADDTIEITTEEGRTFRTSPDFASVVEITDDGVRQIVGPSGGRAGDIDIEQIAALTGARIEIPSLAPTITPDQIGQTVELNGETGRITRGLRGNFFFIPDDPEALAYEVNVTAIGSRIPTGEGTVLVLPDGTTRPLSVAEIAALTPEQLGALQSGRYAEFFRLAEAQASTALPEIPAVPGEPTAITPATTVETPALTADQFNANVLNRVNALELRPGQGIRTAVAFIIEDELARNDLEFPTAQERNQYINQVSEYKAFGLPIDAARELPPEGISGPRSEALNAVRLSTGEFVSNETWVSLQPGQQELLARVGINEYNRRQSLAAGLQEQQAVEARAEALRPQADALATLRQYADPAAALAAGVPVETLVTAGVDRGEAQAAAAQVARLTAGQRRLLAESGLTALESAQRLEFLGATDTASTNQGISVRDSIIGQAVQNIISATQSLGDSPQAKIPVITLNAAKDATESIGGLWIKTGETIRALSPTVAYGDGFVRVGIESDTSYRDIKADVSGVESTFPYQFVKTGEVVITGLTGEIIARGDDALEIINGLQGDAAATARGFVAAGNGIMAATGVSPEDVAAGIRPVVSTIADVPANVVLSLQPTVNAATGFVEGVTPTVEVAGVGLVAQGLGALEVAETYGEAHGRNIISFYKAMGSAAQGVMTVTDPVLGALEVRFRPVANATTGTVEGMTPVLRYVATGLVQEGAGAARALSGLTDESLERLTGVSADEARSFLSIEGAAALESINAPDVKLQGLALTAGVLRFGGPLAVAEPSPIGEIALAGAIIATLTYAAIENREQLAEAIAGIPEALRDRGGVMADPAVTGPAAIQGTTFPGVAPQVPTRTEFPIPALSLLPRETTFPMPSLSGPQGTTFPGTPDPALTAQVFNLATDYAGAVSDAEQAIQRLPSGTREQIEDAMRRGMQRTLPGPFAQPGEGAQVGRTTDPTQPPEVVSSPRLTSAEFAARQRAWAEAMEAVEALQTPQLRGEWMQRLRDLQARQALLQDAWQSYVESGGFSQFPDASSNPQLLAATGAALSALTAGLPANQVVQQAQNAAVSVPSITTPAFGVSPLPAIAAPSPVLGVQPAVFTAAAPATTTAPVIAAFPSTAPVVSPAAVTAPGITTAPAVATTPTVGIQPITISQIKTAGAVRPFIATGTGTATASTTQVEAPPIEETPARTDTPARTIPQAATVARTQARNVTRQARRVRLPERVDEIPGVNPAAPGRFPRVHGWKQGGRTGPTAKGKQQKGIYLYMDRRTNTLYSASRPIYGMVPTTKGLTPLQSHRVVARSGQPEPVREFRLGNTVVRVSDRGLAYRGRKGAKGTGKPTQLRRGKRR